MPRFFDDDKQAQQSPKASPSDLVKAQTLFDALHAARRLERPYPKVAKWADVFRLLRTVNQIEEPRIAKVVDWFCTHLRDKYTPKIFGAEKFRRRFLEIEAAMVRQQNRPSAKELEITDMALEVQGYLGGPCEWPYGDAPDELPCIQLSLNRYSAYLAALWHAVERAEASAKKLDAKLPKGQTNSGHWTAHARLENLYGYHGDPLGEVLQWMESLWELVNHWEGWKGGLLRHAWRYDHPKWAERVEQHLGDYECGADTAALWDWTKRQLKEVGYAG